MTNRLHIEVNGEKLNFLFPNSATKKVYVKARSEFFKEYGFTGNNHTEAYNNWIVHQVQRGLYEGT